MLMQGGAAVSARKLMHALDLGSWRSAAALRARILAALAGPERDLGRALCPASAPEAGTVATLGAARRGKSMLTDPRMSREPARHAPETRALARAIDILEALGPGPLSLAELNRTLPLPYTTLRRLMQTLVARKLVRIGLSDGKYRLNIAILSSSAPALVNRSARLIGAAAAEMRRLTARINLPVDLHIFDDDRMVRVESTHPDPMPYDVRVEVPLNIFAAASGLVYLATLDEAEVRALVERLADRPEWGLARFGLTSTALLGELRDIRRQSFAARRVSQHSPDRYQAVAIPVMQANVFAGSLAVWWPTNTLPLSLVRRRFLPHLRKTGQAIEARLAGG
jgi:IclR family mhp operon transcriptional activator